MMKRYRIGYTAFSRSKYATSGLSIYASARNVSSATRKAKKLLGEGIRVSSVNRY